MCTIRDLKLAACAKLTTKLEDVEPTMRNVAARGGSAVFVLTDDWTSSIENMKTNWARLTKGEDYILPGRWEL
jgi:hypothetical protein